MGLLLQFRSDRKKINIKRTQTWREREGGCRPKRGTETACLYRALRSRSRYALPPPMKDEIFRVIYAVRRFFPVFFFFSLVLFPCSFTRVMFSTLGFVFLFFARLALEECLPVFALSVSLRSLFFVPFQLLIRFPSTFSRSFSTLEFLLLLFLFSDVSVVRGGMCRGTASRMVGRSASAQVGTERTNERRREKPPSWFGTSPRQLDKQTNKQRSDGICAGKTIKYKTVRKGKTHLDR